MLAGSLRKGPLPLCFFFLPTAIFSSHNKSLSASSLSFFIPGRIGCKVSHNLHTLSSPQTGGNLCFHCRQHNGGVEILVFLSPVLLFYTAGSHSTPAQVFVCLWPEADRMAPAWVSTFRDSPSHATLPRVQHRGAWRHVLCV